MKSVELLKKKLSTLGLWDREITYNRWELIKHENTCDTHLYFIEKGCARVYFKEKELEHSLYFGYKGSLISALDSFLGEEPSSLVIECIMKTTVKVISKKTFTHFISTDSNHSELWMNALSDLSLWHIKREKNLMIKSPIERYKKAKSQHPELFQNVPHKYIASYLRMSPETFSRLYKS